MSSCSKKMFWLRKSPHILLFSIYSMICFVISSICYHLSYLPSVIIFQSLSWYYLLFLASVIIWWHQGEKLSVVDQSIPINISLVNNSLNSNNHMDGVICWYSPTSISLVVNVSALNLNIRANSFLSMKPLPSWNNEL